MNNTKKLTQGAMMLAIIGALILVDRMTAYWFTELITLMMPVVIIMYTTMHTMKDGIMLSVGLIIISFLLGNFQFIYLIYVPVGIFTGLIYSWGITRNYDRRRLLLLAIITYTIGELLATFIIYPLLGFPVSQMLAEYKEAFNQASGMMGMDYGQVFSSVGLDLGKIIGIMYVISTIILGIMEGALIHLLSIFLLKRFKIRDLGSTNIINMKPSPILSYISLMAVTALAFAGRVENETAYYVLVIVGIVGGLILFYYGYLFVILFGVIVLRRNIGAIFILLCVFIPAFMVLLLILGFLYGAGPLRRYLEEKAKENVQQQ